MNEYVYTDYLVRSMKEHGSRPCLHIKRKGDYRSWSYADVHRDLNRLSSALKKQGLKKDVNAIVIGENTPEWLLAYHAIIFTGACTVPVDPNLPPSEIESIIAVTEAKVVFCSAVYLDLFRKLRQEYHCIEKIILLEPGTNEDEPRFDRFIGEGDENDDISNAAFSPDDPMVIIFTSGTTGKAKGVVLCQKNFIAVIKYGIQRMKVDNNDTVCAVLPLHHVFGFAASVVAAFGAGMDIVFVPTVKGPLILEALNDREITYLPAVPKMLQLFHDNIVTTVEKKGQLVRFLFSFMNVLSIIVGDRFGQSFKRKLFGSVHKGFGGKLRLIISGGAALGKTYWKGFRQMGFTIVEGYGLTETFGPISVCPGDQARLGSVGPVLPENEIRIVNPDDNGIGEVHLRGICVFKGYYRNDRLTKEVIDDDGWFNSGDLGKLDKDGFLYLAGRKKDLIVLGSGKNVYPDELENYYGQSPLIDEIGVFGIEEEGNETVSAIIVPDESLRRSKKLSQATDVLQEELARLNKTLPSFRRIANFVVSYSALPRTTTRKLKKNDLRVLYHSIKHKAESHNAHVELSVIERAIMDTEEFSRIADEIVRISKKTKRETITSRSRFIIDFGLDSLDQLELLEFLEATFSVTIPDSLFDKMETMHDLVSFIRESEKQGN